MIRGVTTMPSFANAHRLVAQLRGFDLDDDAVQLAYLEPRAAANELTPPDWRFYGLVLYRAGEWALAAEAFQRAASEPAARLLAAYCRLRAGDAGGALTNFESLAPDSVVTAHDLHLARGDALWLLSRLSEAEGAYLAGLLGYANASGESWFDLTRLQLSRGDARRAREALDFTCAWDESLAEAHYLRAQLQAEAGEVEAAIESLGRCTSSREHISRAREDERLSALRNHELFQRMTAGLAPPDLSWLGRFHALAKLRDDPVLTKLGVKWLGEEDARGGGEAIVQQYGGNCSLGVLWNDALWAACQEIVAGKWCIAELPEASIRVGARLRGGLYFDPERPEELLLTPSTDVPPYLWIPVRAEPAAVAEAIGELFPARRVPRSELTHERRAFMGYMNRLAVPNPYSGELEEAGPHELARHFALSPFVDLLLWGSIFRDDPWPDRIPPQPGLQIKIADHLVRTRQQREGNVCVLTHRTKFSRSHVTTEIHSGGLYIWNLRYRPSKHSRVIERLNARFGCAFPTDLPFDVVGAIIGFDWGEADWFESQLPQDPVGCLRVLAALRHSDLGVTQIFRRYLKHENVYARATIANACVEYEWEFLLEDLAMQEKDPGLLEFAERVLANGIPRPQFSDMGELVDVYGGSGDEEADADEEEAE